LASLPQHKTLPLRVRAEMYAQLAAMETAGLPFEKAFQLLKVAPVAQGRLAAMRKMLKGGDFPFAGERSGLFTKLEARLIKASWQAGSPAGIYRKLAEHYTTRAMQASAVRSRMALPAFMVVAALFIQPLPALVGGSISIAGYFARGFGTIAVIGALVYALINLPHWLRGSGSLDHVLPQLPLFGPMYVRRRARDFFESLALMLEAGISMLDSLPAALETVENGVMQRDFASIRPRIEKGATLAEALEGCEYLGNESVVTFVHTGEQSGKLPEMLSRHCAMETEALNLFWAQVAAWVPRLVYAAVAAWIAYGIITSGAFMTRVPADL
jgi:general secretion pathway protein F